MRMTLNPRKLANFSFGQTFAQNDPYNEISALATWSVSFIFDSVGPILRLILWVRRKIAHVNVGVSVALC